MKRNTATLVSYVVPFLLVVVLIPWGVSSTVEFGTSGVKIMLIGVAVHVVLRYGLPRLSHSWAASPDTLFPSVARLTLLRSRCWRFLKLGCTISLAIGLACVVLANAHLLGSITAFFVELLTQQIILILVGYYINTRLWSEGEYTANILCLIALAFIAVFFAWSSNIVFMAQRPPLAPESSNSANTLYSIPVLALVFYGVIRRIAK